MASQFQNRLVGISILVASVVIFLPTIIDGKKTAYEDEFVSTPIHPDIKEHTQALDESPSEASELQVFNDNIQQPETVDETEEWQVEEVAQTLTVKNETSDAIETAAVKSEKVIKPSPVAKPTPKRKKALPENAWTIQLGAFQNAANINALLKKLHKAGFQAHTIPMQVIDGELTRLFVGPDVSKAKLEKQLPRLKRLTNLDGKLIPFDAVNP